MAPRSGDHRFWPFAERRAQFTINQPGVNTHNVIYSRRTHFAASAALPHNTYTTHSHIQTRNKDARRQYKTRGDIDISSEIYFYSLVCTYEIATDFEWFKIQCAAQRTNPFGPAFCTHTHGLIGKYNVEIMHGVWLRMRTTTVLQRWLFIWKHSLWDIFNGAAFG